MISYNKNRSGAYRVRNGGFTLSKFEDFRNQYNSFLYKDYSVEYIESAYRIVYHFEIPGLCEFQSKWEFPAKERVDETILKALAFHLGMAETISYWKCACPKQLKILCGTLSAEQKKCGKSYITTDLASLCTAMESWFQKRILLRSNVRTKRAHHCMIQSPMMDAWCLSAVERIPWFPLRC